MVDVLFSVRRDQPVADLQQFSRAESPFIIAAHEERMFERRLDASVDQVEAVVLAEADLRHTGGALNCARESPCGEPFELDAERFVRKQAGDMK